jgi:hypothetical protein
LEHAHLIKYTSECPDIAFIIVFGSLPDFGAGVVWRACLRAGEAVVGELGDVEVTDLCESAHVEDIGAFEIAVDDVVGVQSAEPLEDREGGLPDELLFQALREVHLASLLDHAFEVSPIGVLHNDAEGLRIGKKEGGLVGDDVGGVD